MSLQVLSRTHKPIPQLLTPQLLIRIRLNDILQNALHVGVEHLHRQFTTLGSLEDGLILLVLTGLQHVVTGHHGSNGIVTGIPVTDIHTLPAPLVANDGRQQFVVLHRIRTVQLVIRCHDGPGIALLHHNLESLQVNLTQCTLRHLRDIIVTVRLLVVGHEMLRTSRRTLALNTLHIACADGT